MSVRWSDPYEVRIPHPVEVLGDPRTDDGDDGVCCDRCRRLYGEAR